MQNTIDFSRLPRPILPDDPRWVELYDFAWKLASRNVRQMPSGRRYMDAAWDPSRNFQWVWDTCFMALYCRYAADQFPGVQSLDNFYDLQRDDGYISMTYDLNTGEEVYPPDRINPPLFAWVEWTYFLATGDDSRLARAAGHIERLMDWIDANRKTVPHVRRLPVDSPIRGEDRLKQTYQLYYFEDGGSSGMDDAPRSPRIREAGQYFDWIDLSSQMALSFRTLGLIHRHLGNALKAEAFERRAREVGQLVNDELWCPVTQFYHDRMIPTNFVGSKTIAGFWPMLAGICPPDRVDRLVEHLLNPREFHRPTPIPTLSADDVNYSPEGTYWVGGVWAPTNYMVTRGLAGCGRGDLAHDIAKRYLHALAETYENHEPHTLWESYSAESSAPALAPYVAERVKPDFVGWTALGPIAMLIEHVIGIEVNVPAREVDWTVRLTGTHGLENLRIGNGATTSFLCQARSGPAQPADVEITAQAPLRVNLRRGERTETVEVQPGTRVRARV